MTLRLALGLTHASCVAFDAAGILIIGKAGSGKSSLALEMLALGAVLVADDQVEIYADATGPGACAPAVLQGLIEARNVGLLKADFAARSVIRLVIDLDQDEPDRLPPRRTIRLGGQKVDLILGRNIPNLAIAARLYVLHGRRY